MEYQIVEGSKLSCWNGMINPGMISWRDGMFGADHFNYSFQQYSETWAVMAENEINNLKNIFFESKISLGVEHIGSTSIPGSIAKPIIDLVLGLESMEEIKTVEKILFENGYRATRVNSGVVDNKEWIFYGKDFSPRIEDGKSYLSLCVTLYGGSTWASKISFRDYMRSHPEDLEKYSCLKNELKKSGVDFLGYCQGKDAFIRKILWKKRVENLKQWIS